MKFELNKCNKFGWAYCDGNCGNCYSYGITSTIPLPDEKSGKWVFGFKVYCSVCGYEVQSTGLPRKCPRCGAMMGC